MCIITNLVKRWRIWGVQEILLSVGSKIITNCDHPFSFDINYFNYISILDLTREYSMLWHCWPCRVKYHKLTARILKRHDAADANWYIINWLPIYFWWRWFKSGMWGCSLSFLRSGLREEKRCLPAKRRYYTEFSPNTDVQTILSKYNRDVL